MAVQAALPVITPPRRWDRDGLQRTLINVGWQLAILAAFVAIAVLLRGGHIRWLTGLNPDESELMAQARAAMRSPVPYTTWTTATTGPIWPLFLALLGVLGFPLTIAFAHLLSAIFVGVLGYLGFTLARRGLDATTSVVVTAFWWLPMVLALMGSLIDFAPLSTEYLPSALLLIAAVIPTAALTRRPWLYLAVGLLCGLAVGAKYQAAPMALAVLLVHLIMAGNNQWRVWLRAFVFCGAGFLLPFTVVGLAVLLDPNVSFAVIQQSLNFLADYGNAQTMTNRLSNWRGLVTQMHMVLLVLAVYWLGARSTGRVQICRAITVLAGLAAVYAGGMGFAHYLIFLYTAIAMAIGLPLKASARLVPFTRRRLVAIGTVAIVAMIGWLVSFGPTLGSFSRLHRHDLATALSASSGPQDRQVAEACPAGSNVVVWGWAPELYVDYSWNNVIPFVNVSQLTGTPKNYSSGRELMSHAIEDSSTDCVVDAVGGTFFSKPDVLPLFKFYPGINSLLDDQYRPLAAQTFTEC